MLRYTPVNLSLDDCCRCCSIYIDKTRSTAVDDGCNNKTLAAVDLHSGISEVCNFHHFSGQKSELISVVFVIYRGSSQLQIYYDSGIIKKRNNRNGVNNTRIWLHFIYFFCVKQCCCFKFQRYPMKLRGPVRHLLKQVNLACTQSRPCATGLRLGYCADSIVAQTEETTSQQWSTKSLHKSFTYICDSAVAANSIFRLVSF